MLKEALLNGLNRILDHGSNTISRKSLRVIGENDWVLILSSLREWQDRELIKILKDPETASDDDDCVEMLHYIDRPDFPNWPNKSESK